MATRNENEDDKKSKNIDATADKTGVKDAVTPTAEKKTTEALKPLAPTEGAVASKTDGSNSQSGSHVDTKGNLTKKKKITIIAGIVAAVIVVILIAVFAVVKITGDYVKDPIKSVKSYQTKTVHDIDNLKPSKKFPKGEPIIQRIDYKSIGGEEATFNYVLVAIKVKNDDGSWKENEEVRKGSMPIQNTSEEGSRYISLVSSARTALNEGKYEFRLFKDDTQIAREKFTITAAKEADNSDSTE